jgi:hypothetical protein
MTEEQKIGLGLIGDAPQPFTDFAKKNGGYEFRRKLVSFDANKENVDYFKKQIKAVILTRMRLPKEWLKIVSELNRIHVPIIEIPVGKEISEKAAQKICEQIKTHIERSSGKKEGQK